MNGGTEAGSRRSGAKVLIVAPRSRGIQGMKQDEKADRFPGDRRGPTRTQSSILCLLCFVDQLIRQQVHKCTGTCTLWFS